MANANAEMKKRPKLFIGIGHYCEDLFIGGTYADTPDEAWEVLDPGLGNLVVMTRGQAIRIKKRIEKILKEDKVPCTLTL